MVMIGGDEERGGRGDWNEREEPFHRDTLKTNLTATNQSLNESNQRIDTLSSQVSSLLSQTTELEVSSLLAQNAELEHLLSKDWLITIDKQTDWVGIGSDMMLFTESDMRKVREWRVVEQARKFNEYISSQVGTVASLTAANENRFKAKEYFIENVEYIR
ncbi:hypothetical protein BLNAU_10402 [Blattamonas nauphoetae]|uniref:Uncharacterized protein n=1 Tax=Blattamonas nauphoetae TaxID=2049346 RepID=A0ABQ9XT18_9EUKA|nr:hypothetical protein BLNAU_10402 [Blattamonas nauphoetae]